MICMCTADPECHSAYSAAVLPAPPHPIRSAPFLPALFFGLLPDVDHPLPALPLSVHSSAGGCKNSPFGGVGRGRRSAFWVGISAEEELELFWQRSQGKCPCQVARERSSAANGKSGWLKRVCVCWGGVWHPALHPTSHPPLLWMVVCRFLGGGSAEASTRGWIIRVIRCTLVHVVDGIESACLAPWATRPCVRCAAPTGAWGPWPACRPWDRTTCQTSTVRSISPLGLRWFW